MNIELFDSRVLRPLVKYLERNGVSAQTVLDHSRIPHELTEEGGWITKRQACDFTLDGVREARSPGAVFAAYDEEFNLDDLGPIANAMRSCKTVKEAFDVAIRLGQMGYQGSEYFLWIDGETTWWCYRDPREVSLGQQFMSDMTLTVYWHLIRIATGEEWQSEQMLIRGGAIDRHSMVERFSQCRANYRAELSALAFPTEFLSRRVPWHEHPARFDEPHDWQIAADGSESAVDAVYHLLASRFRYRSLPTLDQMAAIVGLSPATLKRQLAADGMTYRGLLDRLLFDEACEMLSIPQMTIREVAHELGYSGTNNFVRSFRRMTGVTPGEYRLRQLD